MANCNNCGAPLPLKSTVCIYCTSMNDIDLRQGTITTPDSLQLNRTCARCSCKLITIDLSGNETFLIERCEQCFGLFFDIGELEQYLNKTDIKVIEIDHRSINALITENCHKDYPVSYIKCPVCACLMNRINYGKNSGVVVNKCSNHGIWLDSGQLHHIVSWARAGGFELDKIHKNEMQRKESVTQKQRHVNATKSYYYNSNSNATNIDLIDILKIVRNFFS
jgi:Zn-finger nucleic acid-binding protein